MRSIIEWLQATAERTPEKVAVCDETDSLTFAQLHQAARVFGLWVAQRQEARVPVALFMEKSPRCLAAMMGAAYARCPYSVIDVRQPDARLSSIMATLKPGVVLTDAANVDRACQAFDANGTPVVLIDEVLGAAGQGGAFAAAALDTAASQALDQRFATALDVDPLYINFTSGSTGTPKGVAVCHRSVIDFVPQFDSVFGIGQDDRIGNQAPFDFDVSVKDIYSTLLTGATLVLVPRDYFSQPAKLMDFLADNAITTCTWAVSAMCFVSIMGGFDYRVPETINKVIFSGEVMPPKQLAKWRRALPNATFMNVYGPTEVTCNCTYHVVDREYAKDEVIPVGKPFLNEGVFLLDDDALVTEPGAEGEVCVTGTCLALGYYNDPQRTAAAFVQNPLSTAFPETMYRTGDLARWDENGNLVFSGRKDHQIKHLGQRIELGEIEAAAQAADGVERACCLYDAKRKKISLYYDGPLAADALLEFLSAKLPHYMVPAKLIPVEHMPLTKNGKVDRAALAQMGGAK